MKIKVKQTVEVEISFVEVEAAVRYGTEDMPADFPGRDGDNWHALIAIDNGDLHLPDGSAFPSDVVLDLHMKVCDECSVRLLNHALEPIASDEGNYVPDFFPGEHYGDYIIFDIVDGRVKNWKPSATKVAKWQSRPTD